jgi:hypothetical protein
VNKILRRIKRQPVKAGLICIIVVSGFSSFGNLSQNMQTAGAVKKIADENSANEMKLQVAKDHEDEQAKIAEKRYASGCIMIVAGTDENSFTSLSEGYPVVDKIRRKPLPTGSVVCDANGNTGVMIRQKDANGQLQTVVGYVAFTGNKAVVAAAKGRINRRYYIPNQS